MLPERDPTRLVSLHTRVAEAQRLARSWFQEVSESQRYGQQRAVSGETAVRVHSNEPIPEQVQRLLTQGSLREIDVVLETLLSEWARASEQTCTSIARALRSCLPQVRNGAECFVARFAWRLVALDETSARVLLLAAAHSDREELACAVAALADRAYLERSAVALPAMPEYELVRQTTNIAAAYLQAVMTPSTASRARRIFLRYALPSNLAQAALYLLLQYRGDQFPSEEFSLILERFPQPDVSMLLWYLVRMEAFLSGTASVPDPSVIAGVGQTRSMLSRRDAFREHRDSAAVLLLLHDWHALDRYGSVWFSSMGPSKEQLTDLYDWKRVDVRLFWTVRILGSSTNSEHLSHVADLSDALEALLERTQSLFPRTRALCQTIGHVLALESNLEKLAEWLWSQESERIPLPLFVSYLFAVHQPQVQGAVILKLAHRNRLSHGKTQYPIEVLYVVIAALLVTLRTGELVTGLNICLFIDCMQSFVQNNEVFLKTFLPCIQLVFGEALREAREQHRLAWERLWVTILGRLALRLPRAQRLLEQGLSRALNRDHQYATSVLSLYMKSVRDLCSSVPARGMQLLALIQAVVLRMRETNAGHDAIAYALEALDHLVQAQLMDPAKTLRFLLQQMPLSAYKSNRWPALLANAWFGLLTSILREYPWQPTRRAHRLLRVLLWLLHDCESDPRAALVLTRLGYRVWYAAQWWEHQQAPRHTAGALPSNDADLSGEVELLESLPHLMPNDQWTPRSIERLVRYIQFAVDPALTEQVPLLPVLEASDAFYGLARMLIHGAWAHRSRAAYHARRLRLGRSRDSQAYLQRELTSLREYADSLPTLSPIRLVMNLVLDMEQNAPLALVSAQLMATCGATLRSGLSYEALYAMCGASGNTSESGGAARLARLLCVWLLAPSSNSSETPSESFWRLLDFDLRPYQIVLQPDEDALLEQMLRRFWMAPLWSCVSQGVEGATGAATAAAPTDPADDLLEVMQQSWACFGATVWPWLVQRSALAYRMRWQPWLVQQRRIGAWLERICGRRLIIPEAAPLFIEARLPFFRPVSLAESLLRLEGAGASLEHVLRSAGRHVWSALLDMDSMATTTTTSDVTAAVDEMKQSDEQRRQRLVAYWRALLCNEYAASSTEVVAPGALRADHATSLNRAESAFPDDDPLMETSSPLSSFEESIAYADPLCLVILERIQRQYSSRTQRLIALHQALDEGSPHTHSKRSLRWYTRCIGLVQGAFGGIMLALLPLIPLEQATLCLDRLHTITSLARQESSDQRITGAFVSSQDRQRDLTLLNELCERIRLGLLCFPA